MSDLEYMTVNDGSLISKSLKCSKNYEKEFDEVLAKMIENTYRFCDGDINKTCLMLQKNVYLYEYKDS